MNKYKKSILKLWTYLENLADPYKIETNNGKTIYNYKIKTANNNYIYYTLSKTIENFYFIWITLGNMNHSFAVSSTTINYTITNIFDYRHIRIPIIKYFGKKSIYNFGKISDFNYYIDALINFHLIYLRGY